MKRLFLPIAAVTAAGLALVPLLTVDGRGRTIAFRAYVVVVAVLLAWWLARALADQPVAPEGSPFERPPRRWNRDLPDRAPDRFDQLVRLAEGHAGDLHYLLRPVLRDIAAERLLSRHGVSLDGEPGAAQRLLGDEAWELLRADRPPPADRWAAGPGVARLSSVVDAVEAL